MPRMVSSFGQGSFRFPAGGGLSIIFNGSTVNVGAQNAGSIAGTFTASGAQNTPIVIGGANAALFSVSNGGFCPCNLIYAVDIPDGSYPFTYSAT